MIFTFKDLLLISQSIFTTMRSMFSFYTATLVGFCALSIFLFRLFKKYVWDAILNA